MNQSLLPCLAFVSLLLPHLLRADIRLPAIFSEHVVLMRAEAVPIWGRADAGEHVRVTLSDANAEAEADQEGHWKAVLNLKNFAAGPFSLIVEGKNRLVIPDAAVGEVWLASGQSNMELPLRVTADADAEIANSTNPLLRQFLVKRAGADHPLEDGEGQWTVANPATSGEFTAIGYYFGKELQEQRKTAVGIIHASQGGTYIEPWIPSDVLDRTQEFLRTAASLRQNAEEYPRQRAKFVSEFAAWVKQYGREDQPCPNLDDYTTALPLAKDWTTVTLPGKVSAAGFQSSGVFWIRHEIEASALLARQGFKIMIGPLEGFWQIYWNGEKLEEMTYARFPGLGFPCYFSVPAERIRTGQNTLAIRIYSPTAPLSVQGHALWAGPLVLDGAWLARVERSFLDLPAGAIDTAPRPTYRLPDMLPGSLYNARIHPFTHYDVAGVLWYQGESNVKRAYQYRSAFPALIAGWREKWHRQDLPFYFCQVCNNAAKLQEPVESPWAELRESQSLALALPNTGQAVTIDVGEAGDLHFRDKKTVGHRLFLIAQARHYGQAVPNSGPVYESMAINGSRARVKFKSNGGELVAGKLPLTYNVKTLTAETAPLVRNSPGSELEGFAICGADHHWVWAQARIEGGAVVVWSDKVSAATAVRYAWADNPTCNLYNEAGLPAAPFRTDDFPLTTANACY